MTHAHGAQQSSFMDWDGQGECFSGFLNLNPTFVVRQSVRDRDGKLCWHAHIVVARNMEFSIYADTIGELKDKLDFEYGINTIGLSGHIITKPED